MADHSKPMMDPNAREGESPDIYVPTPRNTFGMDTLIEEVMALFPETTYEVGNRNQRGVAFNVTFTPTPDTARDLILLIELLGDEAYNQDRRIFDIRAYSEVVTVEFVNDPMIQDNRDPFGLAGAYEVLSEGAPPSIFAVDSPPVDPYRVIDGGSL